MTWDSKTQQRCDCGVLEEAARHPDVPIEFDPRLNEFHLVYTSDGEVGRMTIYHCLFCGGLAPPSQRHTLFAEITVTEQHRLAKLTQDLATVPAVLAALGKPDRDNPAGLMRTSPERDGQPPETRAFRTLLYTALSDTANVQVVVQDNERVTFSFLGKYIGDSSA